MTHQVSSHVLMRLLITSYFIAMSLGMIPDNALSVFLIPILPDPLAMHAMHALVLILSCAILFNYRRRLAALSLALIVLYSSYVSLLAGGDVAAFWRDLALMGGLLLTADLSCTPNGSEQSSGTLSGTNAHGMRMSGRSSGAVCDDRAFRKDFDIARAG